MKKIFQKNQLIITALALMIAVAGYFSYMNNHIDDGTAAETAANAGTDALNAEYEISDEDPLAAEDIFTDEGTGEELALVDGTETADAGIGEDTYDAADAAMTDGQDVAENVADGQNDAADVSADAADVADMTSQDAEEIENPGEAVLTGGERVARGRLAPGAHDHLEAIALLMFVIIVAQPSAGASAPLTMLASVWPQKFHTEPIAGIAGARAPDSATFEKSLMS